MAWTDERVAILKKLWMEGLSASQIAAELGEGVTRNAVIGKVHRLKLSGRAKPASSAPRARKPRATAASAPRRPSGAASNTSARPASSRPAATSAPRRSAGAGPAVAGNTALKMSADTEAEQSFELNAESEIFIPEADRIGLMELNEHTCKWPIGDPVSEEFHFCGRHSDEGKPYCEFHSKRAYHSLDRRKKS